MRFDFLRDDSGSFPASEFRKLGRFERNLDQRSERVLRIYTLLGFVRFVLFDVHAHGGAGGAGAGKAEDEAAAVGEAEAHALLGRNGSVDGVGVLEVIREVQFVLAVHVPLLRRRGDGAQVLDHLLARLGLAAFVVVAREEVAAVRRPVLLRDLLDGYFFAAHGHVFVAVSEDGEPREHGPRAVLLADVVRPGAERLFAANGKTPGVHEVAEELPAGGGFEALHAGFGGDAVERRSGGHGARQTLEPGFEVRDALRIRGDDGHGIGGGNKEVIAEDHVAVAVAVGRSAEIRRVLGEHRLHKLLRVREVGVGVAAREVLLGDVVDARGGIRAEHVHEDGPGVRAGDGVHGVELHFEVGARDE